jgi:hypothetical protein
MTPEHKHIAGLELARTELPKTSTRNYLLALDELIEQAKAAPEPVQGEAVEVVACWLQSVWPGVDIVVLGDPADIYQATTDTKHPLMTVAQHRRITAAAKPDAELVELLGEALPAVRYEAQRGDAKGDEYRDLLKRIDAKLAELRNPEQRATPLPRTCRQRLMAEGKPYPKSGCWACGDMSPKWRECDQALAELSKGES